MSQFDGLPEGWILTTISDIADVTKLAGFEFTNYFNYQEIGEVRVVRGLNVGDGFFKAENFKFIDLETSLGLPRSQLKPGDLLITYVGTPGKVALLPSDGARYHLGPNVGKIVISNRIEDAKYLLHFIRSPLGKSAIQTTSKAVTQSSLSMKQIRSIQLPLPPLNEQRRIVEKIEALTARSRKAREALEAIPELLDQFRQSVLAAAFRGDLTADWREQNQLQMQTSWRYLPLQELLDEPLANGRSVRDAEDGFPVLRLTCLRHGNIDLTERKLGAWTKEEAEKYLVQKDDFLVSRGNGSLSLVGKGGLVNNAPDDVAYPDTLIRVRVDQGIISPIYLSIVWNSQIIRHQIEASARTTAGIYKINQKSMQSFVVPVPLIDEQKLIAERVEQSLAILNNYSAGQEELNEFLSKLDQSILAKAFRGDLVPQDPNDEPASVLLDRIRAEREKLAATQKKRASRQKRADAD